MKISVIGAGNVGSLAAMRIAQMSLGEITLVDIAGGIARGKSLDLEDAQSILNSDYHITGSSDISAINGSDIVVITAGLARKPGMTREELLMKNSRIIKEVSLKIKELAKDAVVIVVTNPLDLMTYLVLKVTGFKRQKVIGMGISLDSSRFANLIAARLKLPVSDVEAVVIGSHGEAMMHLAGKTKVKGKPLADILSKEEIDNLVKMTVDRGAQIVANLGSGSAFFAPSAAAAQVAEAIANDRKSVIGVCAFLEGEYGLSGICIGVPCRIGKGGIEEIVKLDLSSEELSRLKDSADAIARLIPGLKDV